MPGKIILVSSVGLIRFAEAIVNFTLTSPYIKRLSATNNREQLGLITIGAP